MDFPTTFLSFYSFSFSFGSETFLKKIVQFWKYIPYSSYSLPRQHSGEEPACQCRRPKRCGFDPWIRKIPWRRSRKWQPTPVFLPSKSYGQRSLAGYSLWGRKESGITEQLSTHTLLCTVIIYNQVYTLFLLLQAYKLYRIYYIQNELFSLSETFLPIFVQSFFVYFRMIFQAPFPSFTYISVSKCFIFRIKIEILLMDQSLEN